MVMRKGVHRRTFASTLGSASLFGLAGCTSVFRGDTSVELLQVGVLNWSTEATSVQVQVLLDDAVVTDVSYDLEADGGGRTLDCTWPSEPGQFGVAARVGDNDWEKRDVTDPESDCAAIWVMIERPNESPSMPINRDCEFYADRC